MADNRAAAWSEDEILKAAILKYVQQGLKRVEVLDFLQRDFPQYPWSLRSLDRRLRHFEINYNDANVKVDEVVEAVQKELEGPGKLSGYRAMHKKIRLEHNLNVTRDQVYNVMYHLDPEGLESRGGVGAKKVRRKAGNFTSRGPNWVHSLDGHDTLMVIRIPRFHWRYMVAWIQLAGSYSGCGYGRQILIPNWLDAGTWNICVKLKLCLRWWD